MHDINEDMLDDTIFPARSCMGMSVSFAIQTVIKGDTTTQVIAHIFWRTVALISPWDCFRLTARHRRRPSYSYLLSYGNRFSDMGEYPKAEGTKSPFHRNESGRRGIAAALVIYKDSTETVPRAGNPRSGWTYAVCAGIYLFTRACVKRDCMVCDSSGANQPFRPIRRVPAAVSCCFLSFPVTGRACIRTSDIDLYSWQRYADREHPAIHRMFCIRRRHAHPYSVSHPY